MKVARFSLPDERPPGLDSPITVKAIKYSARAHVCVFKLTNGWIGSKWRIGAGFRKPVPTLLLEHAGRRSGKLYVTPVLYLRDGPNLVLAASQGGLPQNPQWFANLMAHPETRVHLRRERNRRVHARKATGEERAILWQRLVDIYSDFAKYAAWADREIPVVILASRDS